MRSLLGCLQPLLTTSGDLIYVGDKITLQGYTTYRPDDYWTLKSVDVVKGTVFISFKEERGGFTTSYGTAGAKFVRYINVA